MATTKLQLAIAASTRRLRRGTVSVGAFSSVRCHDPVPLRADNDPLVLPGLSNGDETVRRIVPDRIVFVRCRGDRLEAALLAAFADESEELLLSACA
jgi:hypothetical protein